MSVGSSAMGDGGDLVGDIGGGDTSSEGASTGALNATNQGIEDANSDKDDQEAQLEIERRLVEELFTEYQTARDFDKAARAAFAEYRKYAAGLADPSWASDANLIGSFLDILVAFLYAQNPDVSCKPAKFVGGTGQAQNKAFAESMEIIISKLWLMAKLKKTVKRQVRAALTVGQGWFKSIMWSKERPQPQVEKHLKDMETKAADLQMLITIMQEKDEDAEQQSVQMARIQQYVAGIKSGKEKAKQYGQNVDYVRSDDIQVSLDVSTITDYELADWLSEDMYIPQASLMSRFPRLTEEDCKAAVLYYQKNTTAGAKNEEIQAATGEEAAGGQYSKSAPTNTIGGSKPVQFVKLVEFWDSRDGNIKTMCDGVKKWCVPPYTAPQASLRFYPYFMLEFFPVDGSRHPQSLAGRLKKLQDEYSACRSNQRLTRERSIPGLIFNAGALSTEDAKKLEESVIAEMVGIKPTDINAPLNTLIMAKPVPTINVALWNSDAIKQDMEALSGVQEALQQQTSQQPKTATEASIQQSGMATRTTADRDAIEDMLTDHAIYTAETSLQEIDPIGAERIAGPLVFWPFGMDIQDLLTMVDIDIDAGTTGKPDTAADKSNWATILPLVQKLMVQVRQVQLTDPPLAECLKNLLIETLNRLDDRLDVDQFFSATPPPPPAPPAPPVPTVSVALKGELPAMDSAAIGAKAAGLPPEAALLPAGAPSAIHPGAPDHPGAHVADGEIPLHPHMPQPLPAAAKTPESGGETQKPKV